MPKLSGTLRICTIAFKHAESITKVHLNSARYLRCVRKRYLSDAEFEESIRRITAIKPAASKEDSSAKPESLIKNVDPALKVQPNDVQSDGKDNNSSVESKENSVTPENQFQRLADIVTPLSNLPYETQLMRKRVAIKTTLREFGKSLKDHGCKINLELETLPCVLDQVVPSPVTESYRNKDEFSIRSGVDGNPKTVGFFLESPSKNRDCICVPPDGLVIIRESHKLLAREFQNYIRKSPLDACHSLNDGGHWRNIIVRSNEQGEMMAIVVINPQQLTKEEINIEKNNLKEHFKQFAESSNINLKSLFFQACGKVRCTHKEAPFQLLFGQPHIMEELNGIKFLLSPESFFQVNVLAAEQLYKVIRRAIPLTKNAVVLDICCGIGPISLSLSPYVRKCVGIDASDQAIEDAKATAELNNITNVEFHAGRSEYILDNILSNIYAEHLVAIINPPSSNLGQAAIHALRECRHLKTVIFVSCKPSASKVNYYQLCVPMKERRMNAPFYPLRAVPVDLFPHTNHCELVMLFQRI